MTTGGNDPRGPGKPTPKRPLDASMTLLNEVMRRPLDPGYAAAAARKAAGLGPAPSVMRTLILGLIAVALGLATTVAATELRAPQPGAVAARKSLEQQIVERRAQADALTTKAEVLGQEVSDLQREALQGVDTELLTQIKRDQEANGSTPLHGPGLLITLTDGPSAQDGTVDSAAMVQDKDLQRVVNGLWAGGAEAVAVNDVRLTAVSAVRSAGSAILVDLQPLKGPYRIRAIGDADAMQVALARNGELGKLRQLTSAYGIKSSVVPQSELTVPGANTGNLYYAATQEQPLESTSSPTGATPPAPPGESGPGAGTQGQENGS